MPTLEGKPTDFGVTYLFIVFLITTRALGDATFKFCPTKEQRINPRGDTAPRTSAARRLRAARHFRRRRAASGRRCGGRSRRCHVRCGTRSRARRRSCLSVRAPRGRPGRAPCPGRAARGRFSPAGAPGAAPASGRSPVGPGCVWSEAQARGGVAVGAAPGETPGARRGVPGAPEQLPGKGEPGTSWNVQGGTDRPTPLVVGEPGAGARGVGMCPGLARRHRNTSAVLRP